MDALQIAIKIIETHAPNTEAIINSISKGSHRIKERLTQYAKDCIQPGIVYFNQQLSTSPTASFQGSTFVFSLKS